MDRGRHFISSSLDGTLRLWDCSTADTVATYCHDKNAVRGTPAAINDCVLMSQAEHGVQLPATTTATSALDPDMAGYLIIGAYQDAYLRAFDVRVGTSVMFTPVAAAASCVVAQSPHHVLVGTEKGIIPVSYTHLTLPTT